MSDSLKWVKAKRSGSSGGNCVEVATLPDSTRLVRDSKNPGGPRLTVPASGWRAFTEAIKRGCEPK
jgi:Domain of unknown function (DUF397)